MVGLNNMLNVEISKIIRMALVNSKVPFDFENEKFWACMDDNFQRAWDAIPR